jgi:hypothetical protein
MKYWKYDPHEIIEKCKKMEEALQMAEGSRGYDYLLK